MANESLKFLIDANSDAAVAQIRKAVEAVFGLGNATLSVNKTAADAYRQTQAATDALAGATAAAAERIRAGYEAQRASLDPLYASSRRYENALQTVNAALEAGVIKQGEANQVLALAEARYLRAGTAADGFGAQAEQMGRHSSAMGFQVQNAAFQITDFAVQVGGGQNALRAASQQLPQFLGSFGPWGAVIGGAVAILGTLIPALFGSKDAMKEAQDANSAFATSFNALKSDIADATSLQNEYVAAVKSGNADIIAAVQAEAGARDAVLKYDILDAEQKKKASQDALDALAASQQAAAQAVADRQAQIAELNRQGDTGTYFGGFASAAEEAQSLQGPLNDAKAALDDINTKIARSTAEFNVTNAQVDLFHAKLAANGDILKSIADGTVDVTNGFGNIVAAAQNLAGQITDGMQAMFNLRDAQPGSGWLGTAISRMGLLASKAWDAAAAAAAAQGANQTAAAAGYGGRPEGLQNYTASRQAVIIAQHNIVTTAASAMGSGGGGGGSGSVGSTGAADAASALKSVSDMADGMTEIGRNLSKSLSGDFASAFAAFADGTKSGKDAFNSFAQSVLSDFAKMASQRFASKFISPIFDALIGGLGFAQGGVPSLGGPDMAFAKGGVLAPLPAFRNSIVERPTFFAMGGGARGVMGEAGSEAIMPLARGPGGKLGVMAQGGGSSQVVNIINNHPNAQISQSKSNTNGQDIVTVMIDQVKGAVVDDIARGGPVSDAMTSSFGLSRKGY